MRDFSQLIFLSNVAPYEDIIGTILIRMASSALLMVAFCIYISTLNTYSTVGESQGKGKEAFEDSTARSLKFDDDLYQNCTLYLLFLQFVLQKPQFPFHQFKTFVLIDFILLFLSVDMICLCDLSEKKNYVVKIVIMSRVMFFSLFGVLGPYISIFPTPVLASMSAIIYIDILVIVIFLLLFCC